MWEKAANAYLRYDPSIFLKRLRKTLKNLTGIVGLSQKILTWDLPTVSRNASHFFLIGGKSHLSLCIRTIT